MSKNQDKSISLFFFSDLLAKELINVSADQAERVLHQKTQEQMLRNALVNGNY